jgi:hypothetical protein
MRGFVLSGLLICEARSPVSDADVEDAEAPQVPVKVGYCNPPVHTRFKPGQSGNPSGRAKGSQNLKTIFTKVLDEEISLREGSEVKKVG